MAQDKNRERDRGGQSKQQLERAGGGGLTPYLGGGLWPWYGLPFRRMFEDMDRMFETMQRGFFSGPADLGFGHWMPSVDMRETDDAVVVEVELPGIDPEDVKVECHDDVLIIRGQTEERHEERGMSSRRAGAFVRRIPIPPGVDVNKAEASCKNGILAIRFPRTHRRAENVRQIPITTESRQKKAA
jgi:HSP20 family protein